MFTSNCEVEKRVESRQKNGNQICRWGRVYVCDETRENGAGKRRNRKKNSTAVAKKLCQMSTTALMVVVVVAVPLLFFILRNFHAGVNCAS